MTCLHHLWGAADGLACDNPAPTPHTHVYHAAWTADRRDNYEPEGDYR